MPRRRRRKGSRPSGKTTIENEDVPSNLSPPDKGDPSDSNLENRSVKVSDSHDSTELDDSTVEKTDEEKQPFAFSRSSSEKVRFSESVQEQTTSLPDQPGDSSSHSTDKPTTTTGELPHDIQSATDAEEKSILEYLHGGEVDDPAASMDKSQTAPLPGHSDLEMDKENVMATRARHPSRSFEVLSPQPLVSVLDPPMPAVELEVEEEFETLNMPAVEFGQEDDVATFEEPVHKRVSLVTLIERFCTRVRLSSS